MQLINIGFGNIASVTKIVAVVNADSLPIRRIVQEAKNTGKAIDITHGRKTRAVIIMDSGNVILSPVQPETIASRANKDIKVNLED